MYCPSCAAPIDGMRYCRSCGANVSLVSQSLGGAVPAGLAPPAPVKGGREGGAIPPPPSVESIASSLFSGIGMLLVALAVWRFFPGGFVWWFWLLIPAFGAIGKGVGRYWQLRRLEARPAGPRVPPPVVSQMVVPPPIPSSEGSVTEQTTRRLGRPGPIREEP